MTKCAKEHEPMGPLTMGLYGGCIGCELEAKAEAIIELGARVAELEAETERLRMSLTNEIVESDGDAWECQRCWSRIPHGNSAMAIAHRGTCPLAPPASVSAAEPEPGRCSATLRDIVRCERVHPHADPHENVNLGVSWRNDVREWTGVVPEMSPTTRGGDVDPVATSDTSVGVDVQSSAGVRDGRSQPEDRPLAPAGVDPIWIEAVEHARRDGGYRGTEIMAFADGAFWRHARVDDDEAHEATCADCGATDGPWTTRRDGQIVDFLDAVEVAVGLRPRMVANREKLARWLGDVEKWPAPPRITPRRLPHERSIRPRRAR